MEREGEDLSGDGFGARRGMSLPKISERRLSLSLSGICCGIGS
jgi:hypothetical protein